MFHPDAPCPEELARKQSSENRHQLLALHKYSRPGELKRDLEEEHLHEKTLSQMRGGKEGKVGGGKREVRSLNIQSFSVPCLHLQEAMAASQLLVWEETRRTQSHDESIWDTWYQNKIFTVGRNATLKRPPQPGCQSKVGQLSQAHPNKLTVRPRTGSQDSAQQQRCCKQGTEQQLPFPSTWELPAKVTQCGSKRVTREKSS